MKVTIKFKDPKYCNECPYLFGGVIESFTECWYKNYKLRVKMRRGKKRNTFKVIRSQKCIEENGL